MEFHLYSWLEVLSQWKQGIGYPRWAALANFGYGEPRFIFYPPASWALGAGLSSVFPWVVVSDIYIWLVLVAAGASMFLLARRWLDRRDATFAAVLYAVNPYHLVIVYWRSAFAELLAACLLPLLLLLLLRAEEGRPRGTILLALLLAASWLVNAPAAVMIHYSMALLVLVIAWQRRSARILLTSATAVVLGGALAAFYLFPAVYEQRWVNIRRRFQRDRARWINFLFVHTTDADHDAFNRVISWVVVAEIVLTMAAAWAARGWRRREGELTRELSLELWDSLAIWGAACAVLMLPITNLFWHVLPKLRFMQFPWRWTLCLGVPFTLFIVLGVRRWPTRVVLYLAMLCVIIFAWHHFQAPWWDTSADSGRCRTMWLRVWDMKEPMNIRRWEPILLRSTKIARRVTVDGPARGAIRVLEWSAGRKQFTADMSASGNLALHLFNYPAWRVEVNGRIVQAGTREGTGQMLIPVAAGANRVQIIFVRTWDRTLGAWISMVAVVFVLVSLRGFAASTARTGLPRDSRPDSGATTATT